VSHPTRTRGAADRDTVAALALLEQLQPAIAQRNRPKQNEIVERLIALRAPMGGQWQALANLVLQNGEVRLAREAIDLFVEARGADPRAQYLKAALLERSGALAEAYALMCSLPTDVPDAAANAYSRGTAALFLGEIDEARGQLERATRLQPQSGSAWLSLAMSADLASDAALADRILAAGRHIENAIPAQRAAYAFAEGKVHAERGEHELAFAAFSQGGRDMKSLVPYDREADRRRVEESVHGYSAEAIAAIARQQREPTDRSIFVTGSPRSGTTLVEQILTSHSAVGDGAEISRLPLLAHEIGGNSWAAISSYAGAKGIAKPASFWRHLMDERFPTPGRVVDKSLDTTRFIGLPAALLPDAPLIWLTRNPLDRAWSCFRTFFVTSMPWSYDLEDIAFFFRLEDQLLQRWQDLLGDRLLVVPYESLVAEPEHWIRRILSHSDLAEEPQVFAPHESQRSVTTASVMQVRRPINRRAVGAAEPYRRFLEPFIDAYCR
jgi:tetratricopeptide (TPR) repeat protein